MSDHPTSIPSGTQHNSSGPEHRRYFFDTFGITERLLERCLGEALSAGGDYADLYFESIASTSIGLDESLVKSASQGISAGLRSARCLLASAPATPTPTTSPPIASSMPRALRHSLPAARQRSRSPDSAERAQQDLYPVSPPDGDANIAGKLDLLLAR